MQPAWITVVVTVAVAVGSTAAGPAPPLASNHGMSVWRGDTGVLRESSVSIPERNRAWTQSNVRHCSTDSICEHIQLHDRGNLHQVLVLSKTPAEIGDDFKAPYFWATDEVEETDVAALEQAIEAERAGANEEVFIWRNEMDLSAVVARLKGTPFSFFGDKMATEIPMDTFCSMVCHRIGCRSPLGDVRDGEDEIFRKCAKDICPMIYRNVLDKYKEADAIYNKAIQSRSPPDEQKFATIVTDIGQGCVGLDTVGLRLERNEAAQCSVPGLARRIGDFFITKHNSALPMELSRVQAEGTRRGSWFCEAICDQQMQCRDGQSNLEKCKNGCRERMLILFNMSDLNPTFEGAAAKEAKLDRVYESTDEFYRMDFDNGAVENQYSELAKLATPMERDPNVRYQCNAVHLVHLMFWQLPKLWDGEEGLPYVQGKELCNRVCQDLGCEKWEVSRGDNHLHYDVIAQEMKIDDSPSDECLKGCMIRASMLSAGLDGFFTNDWSILPDATAVLPKPESNNIIDKLTGWWNRK